jgi:tetratricopeptide (TPR) repeat protein
VAQGLAQERLRLPAEPRSPRAAGLLLDQADALRRAGKLAEAEACEAELAQLQPGQLVLLLQRQREAARQGDWERLAQLYLTEGELAAGSDGPTGAAEPDWAAAAFARAGAVLAGRLGRDAEAIAAYSTALTHRPGDPASFAALARSLERAERFSDLVGLYEREYERAVPEAAAARERLLEAVATVREERLDDPVGAAATLRRLIELRPDDLRLRIRLVELDRTAQRFADAVDDLSALAARQGEAERVDTLYEQADVFEDRLADPERAQACYKEVLRLRPGDPRAAQALEASFGRRTSGGAAPPAWDDLAVALRREAEGTVVPERAAQALLKLAEIHERERGRFDDAAAAYRDLLDRVPDHRPALKGLVRAYAALGDHARRADALERLVDSIAVPASRARALTELAELYEEGLKAPESAEETFARALTAAPLAHAALGKYRAAVKRRDAAAEGAALALLEEDAGPGGAQALREERAALAWADDSDAAAALVRSTAAPSGMLLSQRIQARRGDGAQLAEGLGALAGRSPDAVVRAAYERRAALLTLVLANGVVPDAHRRLREALAGAPGDPATLMALADWPLGPGGDAETLTQRAQLAEGQGAVEWLLALAETLSEAGRLTDALAAVERALAAAPGDLPALELARRIRAAGGDGRGAAQVTVRIAEQLSDGETAARLFAEAGRAFAEAQAFPQAAIAFRAVLDHRPRDEEAYERARELLRRHHIEEDAPGPLLELYDHRLKHVKDPEARLPVLIERAALCEREGDLDAAERDLRAALQLAPTRASVIEGLAKIVGQRPNGREEACELWLRYLKVVRELALQRAALLELSRVEARPGPGRRVESAIEHLEAALEIEAPARDFERLVELYVEESRWAQAVTTLSRLASLCPEGAPRAAIELRIADLYRDGLSDPRGSIAALSRALDEDPLSIEVLDRLCKAADMGYLPPEVLEERFGRALRSARALVAADPLAAAPFTLAAIIAERRRDEDARVVAVQALDLIAGRHPPRRDSAPPPTSPLSPRGWDAVMPELGRSLAFEVWRLAASGARKLYAPTLDALGLGRGDRLNRKSLPLAYAPLEEIARAMGVGEYTLYVAHEPRTCTGFGEAFVAGKAHEAPLTAASRFRLGRALFLYREQLGPLEHIDDEELGLFFAACCKVAEVPPPPILAAYAGARLDERARALGKALERKERKALASLGPELGRLPLPASWKAAVLEGAARAGLLVAGELAAAFAELRLAPGRDALAGRLMAFCMSEDYVALRRELGTRS